MEEKRVEKGKTIYNKNIGEEKRGTFGERLKLNKKRRRHLNLNHLAIPFQTGRSSIRKALSARTYDSPIMLRRRLVTEGDDKGKTKKKRKKKLEGGKEKGETF